MSITRRMQMASAGVSLLDPEAGLTLTYSNAAGALAAYTSTERSQPVVMACEVTFPAVAADGLLNEFGASAIGSFVGLRDTGTVLRFRAGDGANPINDTIGVILDVTPPADTDTHTLVWEFVPTAPGSVRAWMDGEYLGGVSTSGGASLESGLWTGTAGGAYATSSSGPSGEPTAAWPGTTESNLRVYINQTSSL